MDEVELRVRYGHLVDKAIAAFRVDPNYAADIINKAKTYESRKDKPRQ